MRRARRVWRGWRGPRAAGLAFFAALAILPGEAAAQRLEVEPERWDFGTAGAGERLTHAFTITNEGNRDLTIGRIAAACACTATVVEGNRLAPGESATLRVTLDTGRYRGVVERWFAISSNDSRNPRRVLVRVYVEAGHAASG